MLHVHPVRGRHWNLQQIQFIYYIRKYGFLIPCESVLPRLYHSYPTINTTIPWAGDNNRIPTYMPSYIMVFLLSDYHKPTHRHTSCFRQQRPKHLNCPRYYFKSYDRTTRQFGQLRLVTYYATYSFSMLLCFAICNNEGIMQTTENPLFWQIGCDLNTHCNDPKSFASCQLGYRSINCQPNLQSVDFSCPTFCNLPLILCC